MSATAGAFPIPGIELKKLPIRVRFEQLLTLVLRAQVQDQCRRASVAWSGRL